MWVLEIIILLLHYFFVGGATAAEAGMPVTAGWTPPEGNTTFIEGTTWCVAKSGVSQIDLQNALDWACGLGKADCKAIQKGGPCYQPDTLLSHASYAFNSYYQQNGNSDIACNFGGTATLTKKNPSYGKCDYSASSSTSSAPSKSKNSSSQICMKLLSGVFMLLNLYFGSS